MLSRRTFLASAASLPGAALAHEGHGPAYLEARVTSARGGAQGLALDLALSNRGPEEAVLGAVYSDYGPVSSVALPIHLAPGASVSAALLIAASDWPGIFTIILDFGEAGVGPVTVIPE